MRISAKRISATALSAVLACALVPAVALADDDPGTTGTIGTAKPAPEPSVVDPLEKAPSLSYKVRSVNSNKSTMCTAGSAVTVKGGLSKIAIKTPVSSVTKKALKTEVTYRLGYSGKKAQTVKKANAWAGSKSSNTIAQAFSLKFSGDLAKSYDTYYRVKVKNLGWLGWAKNGNWAGTTGKKLRIQSIQIKFVKAGAAAPGSTKNAYVAGNPKVSYRVVTSTGSKTSFKSNGSTAGKLSYKAGTRSMEMKVSSSQLSGGIQYKVMNRKGKWTSYTSKGLVGGSSKSTQAQAFRVKLTGELAKVYNVYYRAYSGDCHWLGWAKNGQTAGTAKIKYPLGAIQVKLVPKGSSAPGSTSRKYVTKISKSSAGEIAMTRKAQKYSSSTNWLILLNRGACRVAIFKGSKNNWTLKKYMLCGPGAPGTPTVKGTFTVGGKSYSFGEEKGYSCYYATQFHGNYLFHSVLYYANTRSIMDGTLGAHVSHGCVRLAIGNAKWIYNNIPGGTKVISYN